jgi:hypothetical protein
MVADLRYWRCVASKTSPTGERWYSPAGHGLILCSRADVEAAVLDNPKLAEPYPWPPEWGPPPPMWGRQGRD